MRHLLTFLFLLLPSLAHAQGTLSIALQQQFSFTNCQTFTNACGTPLQGGLLYFYQAGTVATVQNSYQDTGLTLQNPWPLVLDANGRVPNFYLANGAVHARLTDANGIVQFDVPNMLVVGASSGGGGGGAVDPTTVLSTGDIKFRMTQEFVTGWVKLNAQTIGNATSGATQRANADTQNLYVYLWNNCPDSHCQVVGGRGASGLADFNANKPITLPDWRGRGPMGVDDMGNSPAGRIFAQNITSGAGDGVTTPGASGGEALHTMAVAEIATHTPSGSIGGSQTFSNVVTSSGGQNVASASPPAVNIPGSITVNGSSFTFTGNSIGNSTPFNQMQPFLLGSWYVKL
jgi:hypothetical protein